MQFLDGWQCSYLLCASLWHNVTLQRNNCSRILELYEAEKSTKIRNVFRICESRFTVLKEILMQQI